MEYWPNSWASNPFFLSFSLCSIFFFLPFSKARTANVKSTRSKLENLGMECEIFQKRGAKTLFLWYNSFLWRCQLLRRKSFQFFSFFPILFVFFFYFLSQEFVHRFWKRRQGKFFFLSPHIISTYLFLYFKNRSTQQAPSLSLSQRFESHILFLKSIISFFFWMQYIGFST